MTTHDGTVRKVFGVTLETVVRRILRAYERATSADIEAGARWYDEAGELASYLAEHSSYQRDVCAAVISHLSPRQRWTRNVLAAHAVVVDEIYQFPGIMSREMLNATSVRDDGYDDPIDSFDGEKHKTRRFYLNILGDREAVTVDVWACRVANLDETRLDRKGAYDAIEHAYRLAARRRGVDPATMQATTWIVARNGRAS